MTEFKHVVCMRFGIGVFDTGWLDYRLALLKATMLPALAAQSDASFDLLVLVDERMPETYRASLDAALANVPRVTVREMELLGHSTKTIRRFTCDGTSATHRLVTRVDDDDAISPGTIAAVQRTAADHISRQPDVPALIMINDGLFYAPADDLALPQSAANHNAIAQTVVAPMDIDSPYVWRHREIPKDFERRGWPSYELPAEEARWLYTQHSLSDTDYEARLHRMRRNKRAFSPTPHQLDAFSIDWEALNEWREIARQIQPIPRTQRQTHRLNAAERKISDAHKRGALAEVQRLHAERIKVGSELTAIRPS